MIPLITGIAGLALALNGWLYQPKRNPDGPSRWSNYTKWGRILLVLIIFTNLTAIATGWLENNSKKAAATRAEGRLQKQEATMDDLQRKATAASASADASRQQAISLEQQLSKYQTQLADAVSKASDLNAANSKLQGKLETYQSFIEKIEERSERQPQMVMGQFVTLKPGKTWSAPNNLYSGSFVEFYGWKQPIELTYGDTRERIHPVGWAAPSKVAIIGNNGESFKWGVTNVSGSEAQGKIMVYSTPRSRSTEWSWIEEQIATLPRN